MQPMLQQQNQNVSPDAIQAFAAEVGPVLTSLSTVLTNINAGIVALDGIITTLQNSPGAITPADQASLDNAQSIIKALLAQGQAISTTPPGQVIPVTPIPTKVP